MLIKTFRLPPIDNNNYLVIDETSNEAVLIDCSHFNEEVKNALKEVKLKYIILTHGHFDHILGLNDLRKTFDGFEVLMHKDDMSWVNDVNAFLPYFGLTSVKVPEIDRFINDGETIQVGNLQIKVIHTKGHTKGGVCYLIENNLFSGDTIFRESVGRCDLEGGDFNEIVESIENKIFTLPEEIAIYPGHGKSTTVGWEKEHNSYM